MKTYKWDYKYTLEFVQSKRSLVEPNPGFEIQIKLFEKWGCEVDMTSEEYKKFKEEITKEKEELTGRR